MTCDILIRTWRRDLAWLELCLAAVGGHARGFDSTVVVLPRSQEPWLRRAFPLPSWVRLELCPDYRDDYLGQQVSKLNADTYTSADLVCHLDSDCILSRLTTPDDLAPEGRPVVNMRHYNELDRHWPWRAPTEGFLGVPVEHDFMQQPPFVYPRPLYAQLRDFALATHGVALDAYVLNAGPRGFSEFNALGAYAFTYRRDDFTWVDAGTREPHCQWFWTWAGVDAPTRAQVAALLPPAPPSMAPS